MEKSSILGIAVGLVLVYGAIFMGDGWQTFFNIPSLVLVVGGTMAALLVTYSFAEVKTIPGYVKGFFTYKSPELNTYVDQFQELSRVARREGLLALDRKIGDLDDAFMSFGLEMAVDGIDEQEIDQLMKERMTAEAAEQQVANKFFTSAGTYAPAFGMVGTLIGLIQMLQNLTDPSQIGSGMAVALITTFYGALLANLVFLPIASKLKAQMNETIRSRMLVRTGVLSIVRGEAPSMVEKRLQLFVSGENRSGSERSDVPHLSRAA